MGVAGSSGLEWRQKSLNMVNRREINAVPYTHMAKVNLDN